MEEVNILMKGAAQCNAGVDHGYRKTGPCINPCFPHNSRHIGVAGESKKDWHQSLLGQKKEKKEKRRKIKKKRKREKVIGLDRVRWMVVQ